MKLLRILCVAAVALVFALAAGCGGDDDEDEATTPAETTTQPADTTTDESGDEAAGGPVTVAMDEYSFDPDSVSASRGDEITVTNEGKIAHNLTIEAGPDPNEKSRKLAGTSSFLGGKSEKLTVDLEPGSYAMVCTVPGHREQGMVGDLRVR